LPTFFRGCFCRPPFCADGKQKAEGKEDLPIVQYALKLGLANIQHAFDGIFANLEVPFMGWLFNGVLRIWSKTNALGGEIKDGLTHDVAQVILQDSAQRDRLTKGIYIPKEEHDFLRAF